MESCGICAEDYFKLVGLPPEIIDSESLLPEKPFWRLINSVALLERIPDFGERVAQITPWHAIQSVSPMLENCDTLISLLETFSDIASSQASNVRFDVKQHQSMAWFMYHGTPMYKNDVQMELYRATSMIMMIQAATGIDWRPSQVHLSIPAASIISDSTRLSDSKISFSMPHTAIAIPVDALQLPVNTGVPPRSSDQNGRRHPLNSTFVDSIRQIIDAYAPVGHGSIEEIADLADMTVRTLQRRLADSGLKFNDLLNEARYKHAKENLQNSTLLIEEIARSLGYSDPAHFSRAFRRWSGLSPSNYRKKLNLER